MKIFVIGSTGFIGRHVVRRLLQQGHEIATLGRAANNTVFADAVQHIQADRNALHQVKSTINKFQPDVVLDVIPYTQQQAQTLIDTFAGLAQRIVALSSADVYRNYDGLRGKSSAPPDMVPLTEDAPLRETRYPYRSTGITFEWADDYDKILVEQTLMAVSDLPGTILRLPAVYGPDDKQHRLRAYLRRMDDNRPAILISEQQAGWQWTRGYVENIADAIALAVVDERATNRIYNIGEESTLTEQAWIAQIGIAAGWTGDVVTLPANQLPPHLRQSLYFRYSLCTSTHRIRQELNYTEPVEQHDALARTIEWERAQPNELAPLDYAAEDEALNINNKTS